MNVTNSEDIVNSKFLKSIIAAYGFDLVDNLRPKNDNVDIILRKSRSYASKKSKYVPLLCIQKWELVRIFVHVCCCTIP